MSIKMTTWDFVSTTTPVPAWSLLLSLLAGRHFEIKEPREDET